MNDDLISLADGVQSVVLRRPGSDFVAEIPKALVRRFRSRRHFRVQETVVPTKSAHWYLSRNSMDTAPYEGDEIEDRDGNRWTILEVNRSELNETWQCVAQMYAIRFGLDEQADQLRTAYTKSSAGILQRGFRTIKTGIPVRFSAVSVLLGETREETLYGLTRDPIDVENRDMLRRADGTLYEIEKIQMPLYRNGWAEILLKKQPASAPLD